MRNIIILLVLLLSVLDTVNAQNFGNCSPGFIDIVIGDDSPGNPRQTYHSPLICTASSIISQPGLIPVGTRVRFTPPQHTGSTGQKIGTITGMQWSWYPDNPNTELRYFISFTPDSGMYLSSAAMLPNEFEVINAAFNFGTNILTNLRTIFGYVLY